MHEWHLVSCAPQFNRWGIQAEQIRDLRTAISDVKFVNPTGVHGGLGSTRAHNELLGIIDSSLDYETFTRRTTEFWKIERIIMETENTVSIWIGNFDTKLDLDEFIDLKYDDEGEVVPSLFYNQYNIDIDDIDDYLIEKEVFETSFTNLFDMLKGASYDNIIVNNLKQKGINPNIGPNNTVILIYNYQFDSNVLRTINTEFIATVKYR